MIKNTQQTELIWSGKFIEEVKLPDKRLVDKITLPFQTIEVINEPTTKQKYFEDKLRKLCKPYVQTESPMSTLCARAITFLPELFVFIRFPNVSSDNNPAERIIRHTVTARKIQGGTRSPKGSETKTILTSLFDTWKLQGLNPLEQCRLLLAT